MSITLSLAAPTSCPPSNSGLTQIIQRLQARESGALEELIEATQSACWRLALSILKDTQLSQDALQDAYFIVYQRIGQLQNPQAIKSWLFSIVTHCCHDIIRRRGKDFAEEIEVSSTGPDPSDTVNRQDQLRSIFSRLPQVDRTALALREIASLSYEEMAQILQIPLGTVRSRLAKARQRFINLYKGVQRD